MRKLIGILLFVISLQNCAVMAEDVNIQLKDNLKIKLSPSPATAKNLNIPARVYESTSNISQNTSIKKEIKKTLEEKKLPISYTLSKDAIPQTKTVTYEPIKNTEPSMNDRALNMVLVPKMQTRPDGIIYKETQSNISVIDPKKNVNANNNYPGLRGPNQLIVYTPAYGLRTGTNEFGTEAIVENNMVVRLNGADSIIPKNGFVISGHGKAKNWIIQNLQVGTKIYLDYSNNTIKAFLTPDSLLFAAKEKIKEVSNLIEYYKQIDILYNDEKASKYLNTSRDCLRKARKKPEKTQALITEAMSSLDSAIKNAIPYMPNELKGVWLRPVEKNEGEIAKTLEKLSQAGITDVFLETYFHGKTIYPSDYLKNCGVISQREEFVGFDPLEIWIREAHKKDIKIHVWFETFYVGNDNPQTTEKHVLKLYPDWANKRQYNYNSPTPVPSLSEHNGYFLDPSNEQVQMYLFGILNEIVNKYQPDGINLDYIRYPQTVEPSYSNYVSMNWGYTKNARDEFKNMYGIDPINIKYDTIEWDKWADYRQNQITEFVIKARKLAKNNNILLTAVIFPDLDKCISTKMQNWRVWSMNNYVDGFTPLLLTGDKNTADMLLKDIIRNANPATKIYPGLFVTFMGGSMDDLLLQIHKTREYKTKGAVLFDYAHLSDKYIDALTTRVYNNNYEPKENKTKIQEMQASSSVSDNDTKSKKKNKKKHRRKEK